MYKISDFSKITSLSVKALRYYDDEKILVPSCRDSETAYRYYSEEDFQKAQLIVLLRSLEFSISEIKDVLANCVDPKELPCYLEEKKKMIEGRIWKEKELIKKLNLYIKPTDREEISMNYQIELKEIAPVIVASIRYKGKYSDVGKYIGTLYKAVKGDVAGAPIQCYHDAEYMEEGADLELCLPTKKMIRHPDVTAKTLPAIKAICTTHVGSYEKLNLAYKALVDYANEHHLNCITPSREIYVKGPGMIFKGNEDNYITEIIIPYEEIQ
ncbi:MAG TPA: MerR family transcriptional regulator [Anaerovoracaceae bacterium]|nr:MerR family transcriptional regulator [Anaerovoracaceae bacterium]